MHQLRRALVAAISVSTALGASVAVAHADAGSILYVNDAASANCTDTAAGAGSAATPFCTIQAAADAAGPGDTVDITAGDTFKGAVDITSSGTAAAPILFQTTGLGEVRIADALGQTGPALSFTGASYVRFEGSTGVGGSYNQQFLIAGMAVNDSSHITLDSIAGETAGEAIEVTGASSDVTITHDYLFDGKGGVLITAGGSGDVISTNEIIGESLGGIDVEGAPNTIIASNSIWGDAGSSGMIGVSADSTGASIENNVLEASDPLSAAEAGPEISVDSSSAAGTTEDYNVVSPESDPEYSWAGVSYTTLSAFTAASAQGTHDFLEDPDFDSFPYTEYATAPELNSANSAAPGMLGTDLFGYSCAGEPLEPVTGAGSPAYCSRGAVQQSFSTTVDATATAAGALSVDLNSTMAQTSPVEGTPYTIKSVPTPAVSYVVNWGDGTTSAPTPGSATAPGTPLTHTYAKIGTYTITDTAELTTGTTAVTTSTFTTAGSTYTPTGPTRVLDTRKGIGAPEAKVGADKSVNVALAGVDGIPADVTAVALNLTATDTSGSGYLAAVPAGDGVSTSDLNYSAGQTIANSVIVPVTDGSISIYNEATGSADVLADISGYFTQGSGDGYAVTPLKRVLDTRAGTGAPKAKVAGDSGIPVTIEGADSVPAGVTAVAVHVTVTDTTGGGWIAAEADGAGVPGTSSLNYGKGQTISNTVIVPVAANGKIELYNGGSTAVDLLADVSGYFSATAPDAYVPVTPTRVWDTRQLPGWTLTGDSAEQAFLDGENGDEVPSPYPANATMVANATVTNAKGGGYLSVYPAGASRPATSNVNFGTGQTIANLAILGTTGPYQEVDVYNGAAGSVDVIFDVFGYFANN
jgi:hypothetical protein